MKNKPEEELMTAREVAELFRVDETTVRRWVANGILNAVTLPHKGTRLSYRIRRKTVDKLLNPNPEGKR